MHRESAMHRVRRVVPWLVAVAAIGMLLFAYRDLVFSRLFALDTPTEAQSITDRQRDAALALAVIRSAPLTGMGLGEYLAAAQRLDADAARVHNVPLLVAAELGLPGLLLWLWLMAAPFWLWLRPGTAHRYAEIGPRLAPWVAMMVINTFDTTLWLSGNWQTSFLFALVEARAVASCQLPVVSKPVGQ
jgi:O-antigen ligase